MQRPHGKEYMMSIHLGEGGQQGEEGELDGHEAWWWGWKLGLGERPNVSELLAQDAHSNQGNFANN